MGKRCVIVGGADISNYEYIQNCLYLDSLDKKGIIVDDYSEMVIVSKII